MSSKIILKNATITIDNPEKKVVSMRDILLGKTKKITTKEIDILTDINLSIKTGDRIGFLGKNGAGKTSLMRAILQTYPLSSGSIETNGSFLPVLDLGAGMNGELTGRDNIKLMFIYNGKGGDWNLYIERKIIEFSELGDKIDVPIKLYSMGMRARLIFSGTVFQKGDIIILDEAFATGDRDFIKKSYDFMLQKWNEVDIGLTISHDVDEIRKLCNYCYVLDSARIVNQGGVEEMIEFYEKL
jgi:ABC-type polysaccharide/polyol phosphate transport system ATPase subunit